MQASQGNRGRMILGLINNTQENDGTEEKNLPLGRILPGAPVTEEGSNASEIYTRENENVPPQILADKAATDQGSIPLPDKTTAYQGSNAAVSEYYAREHKTVASQPLSENTNTDQGYKPLPDETATAQGRKPLTDETTADQGSNASEIYTTEDKNVTAYPHLFEKTIPEHEVFTREGENIIQHLPDETTTAKGSIDTRVFPRKKENKPDKNFPGTVLHGTAKNLIVCMNPEQPMKISIKRKSEDLSNSSYEESDADLSDSDPTYKIPKQKKKVNLLRPEKITNRKLNTISTPPKTINTTSSTDSSDSSTSNSSSSDESEAEQRKTKKRVAKPEHWNKNKAKELRNIGQSYISEFNKQSKAPRTLKPPCKDNCRLKCSKNIDEEGRLAIFSSFWKTGNINMQRAFISSSTMNVVPKYKYSNAARPRKPNKAFYLSVNGTKFRVCRVFFANTLDISDRMIRTAVKKTNDNGIVEIDMRGRHQHHKTLNPELVENIKEHINSIPRIESHYLRANTTREFIDGSKTVAELYRDFQQQQEQTKRDIGTYEIYLKIFNHQFNIGFFSPKKDQCDDCIAYENADVTVKTQMVQKYDIHRKEKEMCRMEKEHDRFKVDVNNRVVVYDLQAVLQCPRGDTSAFYYKSKLNSYNFTMTELTKPNHLDEKKRPTHSYDQVHCFFWSETDAHRGANEIGSCILQYIKGIKTQKDQKINIIFYSDNCCGQQKNKYIATAYMYAIQNYNIQSITHKFLIKGHTQNEADNVHSLIEKQIIRDLKTGPIYTPHQYISIIKNAKKTGNTFNIHELTHESFVDLKSVQDEWGTNFTKNKQGRTVTWANIKVLQVQKEKPTSFFYKESYEDENFNEVIVRNPRTKQLKPVKDIQLPPAYPDKIPLSEKKKKDLQDLLQKGVIPRFYSTYFNGLF